MSRKLHGMRIRSSNPDFLPRITISPEMLRQIVITIVVPVCILLALTLWATSYPPIPLPSSPTGAMIILTVITLGVAFVMRGFRLRFGLDDVAALLLPDPLFTLYLATLILIGLPSAVLLAMLTPLVECLPDLWQDTRVLRRALPSSAAASVTIFSAGMVYYWISQSLTPGLSALRAHIIGALIASIITCLGAAIVQIFLQELATGNHSLPDLTTIRRYVASPALRFQILLLSVGPLLPLAELLDDIDAEFAWLLFLVPLCAVYYLALMSVRLEQGTHELEKTVAQLKAARRREAELSDYAALITRAQEDERRRLARELHDDTAQALIALSRGLDTLASRRVEPPLSSIDVRFSEELGDLAKRTLESVRRACQDLRPSVLDDLGLSAALESLAHSESNRGPECAFQQHGECVSCAPEVEVTIYRVAQESLANARKHAQATATSLDLYYDPGRIKLRVSDNGAGFDVQGLLENGATSETELRPGLGLLGMRERAALIRAQLTISSVPCSGTTIVLNVPLPS
jgi:signal transduction histidine kinase